MPGILSGGAGILRPSRIIPGMAVVAGHHDAVRELRPVPRARLLFAGERRQAHVLIAGIFSKAPQVRVEGFCGVHAGEWGRAEYEGEVGAGQRPLVPA
jgi:hypothetical protein